MRSVRRKWRSWQRLPPDVRDGFALTWVLLGLSRMRVLCLPFRRISASLGGLDGTRMLVPLASPEQLESARRVSRMIALAARYCPWDANCLAQALTACWWLRRLDVPHRAFLGVLKNDGRDLKAHAWVCSGPVNVCGGACFARYTVVASYASADAQATAG